MIIDYHIYVPKKVATSFMLLITWHAIYHLIKSLHAVKSITYAQNM